MLRSPDGYDLARSTTDNRFGADCKIFQRHDPDGTIAGIGKTCKATFGIEADGVMSVMTIDLAGTHGFHFHPEASQKEDWGSSWINAPTGRIAGGADEMLLNTIAEKILGLPQDHRPDKGVAFNQIPA